MASPLAEMERLIAENPKNREAIFPYIGGEELNATPTHDHHRYVINFHDYPLRRENTAESWELAGAEQRDAWLRSGSVPHDYPGSVASDWPDLLKIIVRKVRPVRQGDNRKAYRERWWQYAEKRPALYDAIEGADRVLAISQTSHHGVLAFRPPTMVFSHKLVVFPLQSYTTFCVLQSRPHEIWFRLFGSVQEDRLVYTPSDVFETFPFPLDWGAANPDLEAAGKACYECRAALMIEHDEGLTKTYNRFHDPQERSPAILELRGLHAAMDRAVLDAYGWTDIPTDCEFLLDYEIDEETWGARRSPTATAGPTKSATKSSPDCWNSTPSGRRRKSRPTRHDLAITARAPTVPSHAAIGTPLNVHGRPLGG